MPGPAWGIAGQDRREDSAQDGGSTLTDPVRIPAATLVLIRDRPDGGAFDLLMLERARTMAFAAGAMVFPGGRIDPGDVAAADAIGPDPDLPARICAIRETIEEVGIAVGLVPAPPPAMVRRLRAAFADGRPFAGVIAAERLRLAADVLVPFARWCPDFEVGRSFDTHFFLARAPAGAEPLPDGAEAVDAVWGAPARILADADAGRRHLIFPTRRNLERLALFAGHDAAVAHARAFPPVRITPWTEDRADGRWLCIPDDRGYPVTEERIEAVRRG